ncbi:tetratricopeptide repeat protein [Fulvivirgaceae bacterium BMA10]|uniref:Tetratricopeptide repeat protein n=1 Tax=Splendidivirga corallicola TaxID=3051826 RepID=A0ABT8KVU3_9BACT|nr:tetratricopeptide repeat protein [Fulvivirgaceae bacterium BMA10]
MGTRQLAAIMFTDMVGYTAMMQENELIAKRNRDRHRLVLTKAIDNGHGKIIQYYGDGTLSIFKSAIEAVKSAVEIQLALRKDPKVDLRIGVHTGDIVYDDEGVYGDGVNIASRIESLAVAGSVMISDKVYDEIKNHKELNSKIIGEFDLKNVRRPIEVHAITNEGLVVPRREEIKGKVQEKIKSIAVMPFVNMSNDTENEYFSDGITEELINALTKIDGLQVTSRSSSFSFKGKNMDAREIGRQLNVASILEGSVRKAGQKVRITSQLISTNDGYHLWSKSYDRNLEDIFALQDEISRKIANKLREKLSVVQNRKPVVTAPTENIEAYNHYLKGLFYSRKWTATDIKEALGHYQKAIELEPAFSLAHSAISDAYTFLGTTGNLDTEQAFTKAKSAAKMALQLDANNMEAFLSLAIIKFFYDWDWEGGLKSVKRALQINPNAPNAHLMYSLYFIVMKDLDKAIEELELAVKIDPLSPGPVRTLADIYYFYGKYEKAIELYDQILTLDPTFRAAQEFKGWAYLQSGDYEKAITIFKNLGKETTHAIKPDTQLGYAYALSGDFDTAQAYLSSLKLRAETENKVSLSLDFATLYTGLKDFDNAFFYLHKCCDEKIGAIVFLDVSPIWKPLKKDPRFREILDRIGL